jgi:peptide/nickel transport system substrate-binding protein
MSTKRIRSTAQKVMPLTVALLLVACGGGDDDGAEEATEGAGIPARAVVAQGVDPTTMDPQNQRETPTVNVLRHFYDPLLERDGEDPTKFNPVLATSWKQVNPTTVEFKLRSGVEFSSGKPFNAATVKYNVDRMVGKLEGEEPPLLAFQFESVAGAEAVDPTTVRITTKYPDPLILGRMAALMMIPTGAVDGGRDALASKPDGTGPYEFVRWDRNNEVVMKAKPRYFLGAAKVKDVVFRTMPEASSRLAAIQTGDVDVITNVPPDNIADVESTGNAEVASVPSARVASIWLNTLDSKPLENPKVRQALNYAIDREAITESVMSGYGTPVATIAPEYFVGHNEELDPYPFDAERAKRLLAEGGYPDGFSMKLMVPRGRYLLGEEVTQAVTDQLADVGVDVQIQAVEFGVFAKATQTRKIPDAFYAAWGNAFFNSLDEMQVAVLSGEKGFSWYSNRRVDALINKAARTANREQHAQALKDAERLIYEDPPFIFLYAYEDLYGISTELSWKPRRDEQIYLYEVGSGSG